MHLFDRLRGLLAGPDPDPQPSRLDLLDGVTHREPPRVVAPEPSAPSASSSPASSMPTAAPSCVHRG
ncbi:hypothetical protein [Myceligenerans crystallogenes]|uniref:Uncharacterized protein n=1 Tax=Myceligenerans crystallogenes TaxID=316335 RepID=A0ABN2NIM8_9MICO